MFYKKKINVLLLFILFFHNGMPVKARTQTKQMDSGIPKMAPENVLDVEKIKDFLHAGFASMVETALLSVVTVDVAGIVPLSGDCETMNNALLEQLMISDVYPKPIQQRILTGGTGFVVKSLNAHGKEIAVVVTNHHVVKSAINNKSAFISVLFSNGKKYPAKIIGTDPLTDLAVLSITSKDLVPALSWGKSSALKAGHFAIAIGSPGFQDQGNRPVMTLDFSVTHGIISNAQRIIPEMASSHITHLIQTDAAINPGNSGGPLFNVNGEVIGINTMGYTHAGGSQGMNMAIPSDLARPIIDQLAKGQLVQRGYIGIQIGDAVSHSMSKHLGMHEQKGVIIDSVSPDSPADRAGLRAGDVILRINNVNTLNHQQVRALISGVAPGKNIKIAFWRGQKNPGLVQVSRENEVMVDVGLLPNHTHQKSLKEGVLNIPELGISFRYYTGLALSRMGFGFGDSVVVDTVKNAPEIMDTLLPGDVIKEINGTPVESLEHVKSLLLYCLQSGNPSIMVLIWRQINGGFRPIHKILWTSPGFLMRDIEIDNM